MVTRRTSASTKGQIMTNHIHKAMGRSMVVVAATGVAALALASPASAGQYKSRLAVDCPPPFSQECNATGDYAVPADGTLYVSFHGDPGACADIVEHIRVNGVEFASGRVGPGQSDVGVYIEASDIPPSEDGQYHISLLADGVLGGCNNGSMSGWAGLLEVETGNDA
jgi:hypothetical protein